MVIGAAGTTLLAVFTSMRLDGLAGLFSNIGVANAAEAKAVINAILNQNTENLTPKQKSMLGTGIYRDISEQLDVKDAAGNQITRTSKVVLPSGQIVESR